MGEGLVGAHLTPAAPCHQMLKGATKHPSATPPVIVTLFTADLHTKLKYRIQSTSLPNISDYGKISSAM